MSNIAIAASGLSKSYRLGRSHVAYKTLRESVTDALVRPVRALTNSEKRASKEQEQTFWALKDVSFEVRAGEVLGIIGKNGAGKSTLLKILARITEPTCGEALIYGRIGSLLEVGTGFHPELSGRENIYLNGAILGMSRSDIRRRFDEIVAFAEVERFLDTPVKRYSSGMYMRLAFSVAAHLEPEVLVIDEVLAVGDAEFQRKCLGKMEDVATSGRTVLFVSHNLTAMQALSQRCLLLEGGQVTAIGDSESVIARYVQGLTRDQSEVDLSDRTDRVGSGECRLKSLRFEGESGNAVEAFLSGYPATFAIRISTEKSRRLENISVYMAVVTGMGAPLFLHSNLYEGREFALEAGNTDIRCTIPRLPLSPGIYRVDLGLKIGEATLDHIVSAGHFQIVGGDYYKTGHQPPGQFPVLLDATWTAASNVDAPAHSE